DEIAQLALPHKRVEPLVTALDLALHHADGERKIAIALSLAETIELSLGDIVRAFRAYQRALKIAPLDDRPRRALLRLAKLRDANPTSAEASAATVSA